MLKLKLQYFCHLMWRADSLEKSLTLGKIEGQEKKGMAEDEMIGWHHQFNGYDFEQTPGGGEGQGSLGTLQSIELQSRTWLNNWTVTTKHPLVLFWWTGNNIHSLLPQPIKHYVLEILFHLHSHFIPFFPLLTTAQVHWPSWVFFCSTFFLAFVVNLLIAWLGMLFLLQGQSSELPFLTYLK